MRALLPIHTRLSGERRSDAAAVGLFRAMELEDVWRAALERGDPDALKWLAQSLEPVDDNELGGGD